MGSLTLKWRITSSTFSTLSSYKSAILSPTTSAVYSGTIVGWVVWSINYFSVVWGWIKFRRGSIWVFFLWPSGSLDPSDPTLSLSMWFLKSFAALLFSESNSCFNKPRVWRLNLIKFATSKFSSINLSPLSPLFFYLLFLHGVKSPSLISNFVLKTLLVSRCARVYFDTIRDV